MGILGLGVRGWNWRIGVGAWYSVIASLLLASVLEAVSYN